jgi:hypothetical protein
MPALYLPDLLAAVQAAATQAKILNGALRHLKAGCDDLTDSQDYYLSEAADNLNTAASYLDDAAIRIADGVKHGP